MSARHTFAASLAGLLIVEAATLAQEPPRPATKEADAQVQAVVAIPRPQAIRLLLAHVAPGSNVRVELADGSRVEGTIVELSADAVIVADGKFRKVVMVSDANAARFEEDHNVGFTTVYQNFGDVLTTDQVLNELLVEGSQQIGEKRQARL